MIYRILQSGIEKSLKIFPAVGIIGSRQVGKTTLAKKIKGKIKKSIYLDLEYPPDLYKLEEATLYLERRENDLVIIDEIQRKPELFPLLRALIDKDRRGGRFLILGSSSPDLIKKSSESLAGRIIYHELSPLNFQEIKKYDNAVESVWLKGGYPNSFLMNDEDSFNWRFSFISTYLERDIPQFGIKISPSQLRKFWTMLAHNHGQIWNASQIAGSLGVSYHTVNYYLNVLSDLFLVRVLPSYKSNLKKRIVKSPKVYLRDTGILHALLNIRNLEELSAHPVLGHSWEGFVIEQVSQLMPRIFESFYYRTSIGNEIDLVIVNANKPIAAIEVKYSLTPQISKGFLSSLSDLKLSSGIILYPGKEEYEIKEKIFAIPVEKFLSNIQNYLK